MNASPSAPFELTPYGIVDQVVDKPQCRMTKRQRAPRHFLELIRRVQRIVGIVSAASIVALGVNAAPAGASSVGAASAWGANKYGELGDGTITNSGTPVQVAGLPQGGVTTIAAGARHSLAIRCDGAVVAWGRNTSGELGNGTTRNSRKPVQVRGLGRGSGVIAVDGNAPPITLTSVSGNGHSMALKSSGAVLGWGNNFSGEVGNGVASRSPVLKPVTVKNLGPGSGVVAIAAGGSFSVALKKSGKVLAWGNNNVGELGTGTRIRHPSPVAVTGLGAGSGVVAIAAGTSFAMALKSNGAVLTWGNNRSGELGNGITSNSSKPVHVTGLGSGSGIIAISAGDAFALALKSDGTVLAWGNNQTGELGDGNAPLDASTPQPVVGLGSGSGVVEISTGFSHALARTSSGNLYAWGDDHSGQLGDGGTTDQSTPELLGTVNWVAVSAGGSHTLALHPLSFTTTVHIGDSAIMEGDTGTRALTFPVTLSQPSSTKVTVNYAIVAGGTGSGFAKPGVDFKAARGTVIFTPSSTTGLTAVQKLVTATIYSDTRVESKETFKNETFKVVLSSPCSCVLGRSPAVGTIIDHHRSVRATVGIGGGSIVVGTGDGRRITFPVTLSKPASRTVTVKYTVSPSSATQGPCSSGTADFSGKPTGTIAFKVSTRTGVTPVVKRITFSICPDPGPDPDETFTVTLSGLTGLRASQLVVPTATALIVGN
jgi:alpha-tubulin suppressor-like RCC1 family protein